MNASSGSPGSHGEESGWDDLVAVFTKAGLPLPPVPAELATRLAHHNDWFWSTRDMNQGALYDPGLTVDEASTPVENYLAIGQTGHGVNSWFLTYQLVYGPLALFAQVPWGAVSDRESDVEELSAQYAALQGLIDLAARSDLHRANSLRLIVLASTVKGIDVCTWVKLDGRPRPELQEWPRNNGSATALPRAAAELGRLSSGFWPNPDKVAVTVELEWSVAGPIKLVDERLDFPRDLPIGPGLYRFRLLGLHEVSVYIGEAMNLRRRADHYRLGNENQRTNRRLNGELLAHLAAGGTIEMSLALSGQVNANGESRPLELGRKMTRLLAENAALHAVPPDETVLNLRGVGEPSILDGADAS